jgi:hypothetical protein
MYRAHNFLVGVEYNGNNFRLEVMLKDIVVFGWNVKYKEIIAAGTKS